MAEGGEIFVLDMGMPVKISFLAEQMIRLSGLVPDEDIKIKIVGLRPGEKLYEELFYEFENEVSTNHEKIRLATHPKLDTKRLNSLIVELKTANDNFELEKAKSVMLKIISKEEVAQMSSNNVLPLVK
jgi:FlaA1/EpsC-like NDP-sugar epimerase